MPKRTSSSRRWLQEHFADPYVKQAHQAGYRSRAVYKLLELQERYRLFKPGMIVVDLGAAPGGWSQLVVPLVMPRGKVVALDILPMDPIDQVEFIQGDFSDEDVLKKLNTKILAHTGATTVDWVISDIAPNMSGNDIIDIPRAMYLSELVLDFAKQVLNQGGGLVIKMFQGQGFDALLVQIRSCFGKVVIRKPKASRDRSREIYILAREFHGKEGNHACL